MRSAEGTLFDLEALDRMASGGTALHRLDPRAKVLVTFAFILCVASFDRHRVASLLPFLIFPAFMISAGGLPLRQLCGRVAMVLPFAVAVGAANPLLDREILLAFGPLQVTGGWVSLASLIVRGVLSTAAVLALVAVTGFPVICAALEKVGVPGVFVMQLLFLYRYIFVLAEEGARVSLARELRSRPGRGRGLSSYAPLLGHLLLRTWTRAERVHAAMLARGFSGGFPLRHDFRFGGREIIFTGAWCLTFLFLRLGDPVSWLAAAFAGGAR